MDLYILSHCFIVMVSYLHHTGSTNNYKAHKVTLTCEPFSWLVLEYSPAALVLSLGLPATDKHWVISVVTNSSDYHNHFTSG